MQLRLTVTCGRRRRGKYVVDWRDGAGVRHWRSFHRKDTADAYHDTVGPDARQRLTPTVPAAITMQDYVNHWTLLISHTIKQRTLACYMEILRLHWLPSFAKVRVLDLDRGRIKLFLAEKLNAGLDKWTVRNIQSVMRAMLNHAIEDGEIGTGSEIDPVQSHDARRDQGHDQGTAPTHPRHGIARSPAPLSAFLRVDGNGHEAGRGFGPATRRH